MPIPDLTKRFGTVKCFFVSFAFLCGLSDNSDAAIRTGHASECNLLRAICEHDIPDINPADIIAPIMNSLDWIPRTKPAALGCLI